MLIRRLTTLMIRQALTASLLAGLACAASPQPTPPTAQVTSAAPAEMLQFAAGGHALGFTAEGVYAATGTHALNVDFVGANSVQPQAEASAGADGKAASLGRVTYPNLWDGINLAYTADPGGIYATTYTLAPGADPADIRLRYNAPPALNTDGTLSIAFETGEMTESAPIAWQEIEGRRVSVDASFRVNGKEVGFRLGAYDRRYAVTIDPSLFWHTFLGGTTDDSSYGITVDGSGNIYVTGTSAATWGNPLRAYSGYADAYVAKLDAASGALTWNTFLGGSGNDIGCNIAIGVGGTVYVTGFSNATWGSPLRAYTSSNDAFVAKLTSAGALTWNTFLGGSLNDGGNDIAVDASGNAYVVGTSTSTWGSPVRAFTPGAGSASDSFVARLSSAGSLDWNTFLGGSGSDSGSSITIAYGVIIWVMGSSNAAWDCAPVSCNLRPYTSGFDAYIAVLSGGTGEMTLNSFLGGSGDDFGYGITWGSEVIHAAGYSTAAWGSPLRPYTAGRDVFVATLSDLNGAYLWNTFLGGSGADYGADITTDADGNIYVTGESNESWGSPVSSHAGGTDAFAAKLNASGALTWNTFAGSNMSDYGSGIAVDADSNVYLAGASSATWSTPYSTPLRPHSGGEDGLALQLNSSGDLYWHTFLGSGGEDYGNSIAVDSSNNVYVVGDSIQAWGSPLGGYVYNSGWDGFVVKLDSSGGLVWSLFLGGSGNDHLNDVTVDGSGNVYVIGYSDATWGSPQHAYTGGDDAFVAKLTPSGSLEWSTFVGGDGHDIGYGVYVNQSLNVIGHSTATWGSPLRAYTAGWDVFVAQLTPVGGLIWNTFLGGSSDDVGSGITMYVSNIFVAGHSFAAWGSPLRAYTAGLDAFAARLDINGNLAWNTFLGGDGTDGAYGISRDGDMNVYVVGNSNAAWSCAPTACTVRAYSGGYDGYAAKLTPAGDLTWNTFVGGSGTDTGYGIAIDGNGNSYMTGRSSAAWGNPLRLYTEGDDAYVAKLNVSGALVSSTFLGGHGDDVGRALALDLAGNVYLTGYSNATWGNAPLRAFLGGWDAFTAKVDVTPPAVRWIMRADPSPTNASTVRFTVTFSEDVTNVDAGDFTLQATGISGATISGVVGSGSTYTVTVSTGTGSGTLRLDVVDDDSIWDVTTNPLGGNGNGNGNYPYGEVYTIRLYFVYLPAIKR